MNSTKYSALAIALGLGLGLGLGLHASVSAAAEVAPMSKATAKVEKTAAADTLKAAKVGCGKLTSNSKSVCLKEANGAHAVRVAEIDASVKPGMKSDYAVAVARAEAQYSVAREKCNAQTGNDKDICVKEAKSVRTTGTANAKTALKTAEATKKMVAKTDQALVKADDKIADANKTLAIKAGAAADKAGTEIAAARKEGEADKRRAELAVAIEKCDKFTAGAKATCVQNANASFGK